MPTRSDTVVTNMPTDVFSINLVSERGLSEVEDRWKRAQRLQQKRASAADPSQLYVMCVNFILLVLQTIITRELKKQFPLRTACQTLT